jgi:hypothetical protein
VISFRSSCALTEWEYCIPELDHPSESVSAPTETLTDIDTELEELPASSSTFTASATPGLNRRHKAIKRIYLALSFIASVTNGFVEDLEYMTCPFQISTGSIGISLILLSIEKSRISRSVRKLLASDK